MKTDLIPRRTVLKGLGAVMALPWLEAMGVQTGWAAGNTPVKNAAPNRMAFLYVPNGVNMDGWRVGAEGALPSKLPPILAPLNNVRSDFSILTGLAADKARANGDGGGDHARAMSAFLTGAQPRKTDGANIRSGVSADQLAASRIGDRTRLASLEIGPDRGDVVGVVGASGTGKSTLIRTLLGHVTQRSGRIALFGQDCSQAKPHQVARLGVAYVPEGRGVFPNLSVRENLVMTARPGRNGQRDWSYERVLDTFPRLAERLGHLGAQLSGGEQQMLAIGRALMTHPDLIILDEATEGLAPLIVAEIWRVIGEIRASGIATLIVDRDYRRVLARADRAPVLQKGQVVLAGSAEEVAGSAALAGFLGV